MKLFQVCSSFFCLLVLTPLSNCLVSRTSAPPRTIPAHKTNHHGSIPSLACVNVPVGPSGPSSATRLCRHGDRRGGRLRGGALRFVLVKHGETAFTLIPAGSSSIAMAASVIALRAVLDAG